MNRRDEILATALTMPPGSVRTTFIEAATADDPNQRLELLKLLKVHDEAGSFLELAAWEQDSTVVSNVEGQEDATGATQILERLPQLQGTGALAVLKHFHLLELVGEGGSACVFRARDQRLQRDVAIKILKPALAANSQQRLRFLEESKMIAGLRAEHIVNVYEVGEDQALPYFVMEYLPEGSLQTCLSRRGPLNLTETLIIAKQVLDALEVAHARGLLHRDIKPSNVLVDRFPDRVKLGDFGLARTVLMAGNDHAIGTPQFSSPEQIRGDAVDERTDLFGFGCLLYSLMVGHSPFTGTSRLQTIQMTLELDPEPLSHFGVAVPPEFQQLLDSLLAKSRDDRPSDLQQIKEQLRRIASSRGATQPDRRKWLGAAGGLALAGGLGYLAIRGGDFSKTQPVLPASREIELNLYDGSLAPFLHTSKNVSLVSAEQLTLTKPMYYWRANETGKVGSVTYRFVFPRPVVFCRLFCQSYLALVFDQLAWAKVWVGTNEAERLPAISLQIERLEYWPEPGARSSLPLITLQDSDSIRAPLRWLNLSQLLRGKKTLFVHAELFGSKDIKTWAGKSLGPAGAQFLRTDPELQQSSLKFELWD